MAHTEIKNDLPFEVGVLHLADREGVPVAVAVTKATYSILPEGLTLAEEKQPIYHAGQPFGEPGKSSYRYEPECSYFKPSTDVVLIGNATAPRGAASQVEVDFSVGSLRKKAVVFGDRFWFSGFTGPNLVGPEPFQEVPLIYERAFGGWDRSHANPALHVQDSRNPLGCGFQKTFAREDRLPLPNIEDPRDLIRDMKSSPNPIGFGFTNPDWQPRAKFAGTFDKVWMEDRMPGLPGDFDLRFFNAASSGLVAQGYLLGNESVRITGCSVEPASFDLPGTPAPACHFHIAGQATQVLSAALDTVVVNMIERIVTLTWRCHAPLPRGPEQLRALAVGREI
ncbi:MAG TPA: DUF2169 domain-containing protein [Bryobacteraceae bacterium]